MPVSKEGKLYYTKEQLIAAKQVSALDYARATGYELVREGNAYTLKEHDSMVFTADGRWYWNSRQLSGRALDFIVHYEHRTVPEAVDLLVSKYDSPPVATPVQKKNESTESKPFQLPPRAGNMKRLFAYLCGTRNIDREILEHLIKQKCLYEGLYQYTVEGKQLEHHNAVFVGLDEAGVPRSAYKRGLTTGAPYKRDVAGSQKEYAFCVPGRPGVDTVFVFEASIDAMSHATLHKLQGKDWRAADRIALGGVGGVPLFKYLEQHSNIRRIGLALDADLAGQAGCKNIAAILKEKEYTAERGYHVFREPEEKDWNDYLGVLKPLLLSDKGEAL